MIVWASPLDVSTYAARGREIAAPAVRCPARGGVTGPWSGYRRHLRADELLVVFVPRVRCRDCGRTDALLPWFVAPYRYDSVDVIGAALELSIGGFGMRRIAAALARPETTVRDWIRRFGRNAGPLARTLLGAAVAAGWSGFELPVAPGPSSGRRGRCPRVRLVPPSRSCRALARRRPRHRRDPARPQHSLALGGRGGLICDGRDTSRWR